MNDAKPVGTLLMLEGLALLGIGAWWLQLPEADRVARLVRIMMTEQVRAWPPLSLVDQGIWLGTHRLSALQSMTGLLVLGGIIGIGQGMSHRTQDPHGGYRLGMWTAGVLSLGLLLGLIGGYIILPWPMPFEGVACGGAFYIVVVGYLLGGGRPYVP